MRAKLINVSKVCLAAVAVSLLIACPAFASTKAYSNGSSVNIRSEATTDSEVLGKLNVKQGVGVVGVEGDFFVINYNEQNAYVFREFISFESVSGTVSEDGTQIVNHDSTTVHGEANSGDVKTFTGKVGSMLLFEHEGTPAFIHKDAVDSDFEDYLPEVSPDKLPVKYAQVTSGPLNLRSEPSTDSTIVTKLYSGAILDILEQPSSEWIKVKTSDEKEGFVSTEFVDVKFGVKPVRPQASGEAGEIVEYAKQYLGTPYVYGGTRLGSGVDCSGFVYSVFNNFGVKLNRTSSSMPANGTRVAKSDLVAGDLVFFSNYGAKNIQHVGIYCGDGTFIHAASGSTMKVIISGLNESYYVNNYITAARVL